MTHDFPFDHFLNIGSKSSPSEKMKPIESTLFNNETSDSNGFDREELNNINNEVLNHLRTIVNELKFKTYFENNLELKNITGEKVTFVVKTSFIKKSVENFKD